MKMKFGPKQRDTKLSMKLYRFVDDKKHTTAVYARSKKEAKAIYDASVKKPA